MEYVLKRSKRKTIAIHIIGGAVEVRAPLKMPGRDIDSYVESKKQWIMGKLPRSCEQAEKKKAFNLDYGDKIALLGDEYAITARDGEFLVGFDGEVFYMPPGLNTAQIKYCCVKIYRNMAKKYLPWRVDAYAGQGQMCVKPTAVKISNAKKRWGSCSSKRSLNFSWRLMMADEDVADYVVVHELAHMLEMNHSKMFWDIVEEILPDYREREKRLRAFQDKLDGEDWGKY